MTGSSSTLELASPPPGISCKKLHLTSESGKRNQMIPIITNKH